MTQQNLAGKTKTERALVEDQKPVAHDQAELIASLTALTQKPKPQPALSARTTPVQPPEPIYTTGLIREEQHCTEQIEEKVYELPLTTMRRILLFWYPIPTGFIPTGIWTPKSRRS